MRIEYELMHDSLVSPILQWLGEEFWATQQVHELLRTATPAWCQRQHLLSLDDLRLVHEHRQQVNLTADELALVYASAVVYDEEVADWQAQLRPAARLAVLRQLLKHNESLARQQAAHVVQEFASRRVASRLAALALRDNDADVRHTAAQSLAAIAQQDVTATRVALTQLVEGVEQPALAERAIAALVQVRDQAPVSQHYLPPVLRRSILWQVWAKRWQRNRATILAATVRGLQGGLWGLALGMGPLLAQPVKQPVRLDFKTQIAYAFTGVAVAGFIGAIAAGSAAFANVTLRSLQDDERPWRTWLVTTLVGGAMMAPPFVIVGWVVPQDGATGKPALTGLLVGLVLVGVATLPYLPTLALRVASATLAGMLIFVLCQQLRWFAAGHDLGWSILVGGAAGYGFALGFGRSSATPSIIDH